MCVWVVSSVVSVCEGNVSGQGMLGNAKQHGTDFSLGLQGQHPREWTRGILTSLVYTHAHTHTKKKSQDIERMMGDFMCVAAYVCVCV